MRCVSRVPTRLVGQKKIIEKSGFKDFKQFDTEKNMKNADRVMQLNIQIPQTMFFSNDE